MKHVREWINEDVIGPNNGAFNITNRYDEIESCLKELRQICENLKTTKNIDGKTLALVMQGILNRLENAMD